MRAKFRKKDEERPKKGRAPRPIDWTKVDQLLEAGCLGTEISAFLGFHPDIFYERVQKEKGVLFTVYMAEKRAKGDSLLRTKQFQMAMNGDRAMAIWLGKQRLDQREKIDQKVQADVTQKTIVELPDNGRRNKKEL